MKRRMLVKRNWRKSRIIFLRENEQQVAIFFVRLFFFDIYDSLRTYNSDLKNYAAAENFKNCEVADLQLRTLGFTKLRTCGSLRTF